VTDCARCGDCCDPVFLTSSMVEILTMTVLPSLAQTKHGTDAEWLLEHWHFIDYVPAPSPGLSQGATFRCDKFDPVSRQCTAHDERPQVCRGYPWYGKTPKQFDPTMGPRCSFVADVPGRLLPIVAVT
jgi:Fe-S-cluster containining protein